MAAPLDPLPQAVVAESEKIQAAESARSASGESSDAADPEKLDVTPKKRWYKKLNPMRWQKPPPVPEERTVSKEYGAGFFSTISFQWMSPLMRVSPTGTT